MTIKKRESIIGLSVAIPMVVYILIFLFVPLLMLFYYSFTNYGIAEKANWIGFNNFINIFKYPEYMESLWITLQLAVLLTGIGIVLGFLLALFMNSLTWGKDTVRVIWYLPGLLSMAILSQFITMFLAPNGSLNKIIEQFGAEPVVWTQSKFWMFFFIVTLLVWKGMGGTAILFLAGLNSISKDVYEAAAIDGAKRFEKLIYITMPLIRPMFGFILITGFMGAMSVFEPVLLISGGGPDGATKVILYRIYDEAFRNFKYGFACSLSLIVAIATLILTLINIRFTDNSIFKLEKE